MKTKKLIPLLCIAGAALFAVAAILLTVFSLLALNKAPTVVKFNTVESFTAKYALPSSDVCEIDIDFIDNSVTVKRTILSEEYTLSASDTLAPTVSASDAEELVQSFTGKDLSQLEQYIIEHSSNFFVDDANYNLMSDTDRKPVCTITVLANKNKYYHMEWMTREPYDWMYFVELVRQVTGTEIELS